ncbi:iron complex outermembrane recepter protein [Marinospirillum celere]|uniref:Iron complex outermembrane recepter protein n=1 Tax=Marinospirillum celere TaxID=1122252 RepID=A0A1I1G4D0_9GAMM|nr:TonB-dependent receptor [Marinospirillum celere]SFC06597.1 iron complex outermembrane recepter protein [Marinospirillum celere]
MKLLFRYLSLLSLLVAWAFFSTTSLADEPSVELPPLTVTAAGLERELKDTAAAISYLDSTQLQSGRQQLQLDESLNRVPGTFFQNRYNFAQNLRLSIRGFGARAPFGIRGLHLRVDGFPETLPDGQSQVDTIDLQSLTEAEVLRGPSSALYGNAAGGVVLLRTRDGSEDIEMEARGQVGSDDFYRIGALAGGQNGRWTGHVSGWQMRYQGYREQSQTEKRLINTQANYWLAEDRNLRLVFTALDQPLGQDPAGLTRQQARENPGQASANALALNAGQEVQQQRLGLEYSDRHNLTGELRLQVFYSHRDFQQQLPFPGPSLIEFERHFYGLGGNYRDSFVLNQQRLPWVVGVELLQQSDDRQRYSVNPDAEVTGQSQDALETATSLGVYGEIDWPLTSALTLTLGGRYDQLDMEIEDRFTPEGQASGKQSFDEFSTTLGLSLSLNPDHQLYARLGTSFESPTFTEFYDPNEPEAGFDPQLKPQQALNLETGLKGAFNPSSQYQLAVFQVTTDDEIIKIASDPDRFANAGKTRRLGLEASLDYNFNKQLVTRLAYTWSDFRFRRFEDEEGNNLNNKRLPGLPEHQLFAELAWRETSGFFAIVDSLLISEVYADNQNSRQVSGYGLVNSRLGSRQQLQHLRVDTYIGINNLFNRDYPANLRINSGDNYLEPGPGRHFYAGINLRY